MQNNWDLPVADPITLEQYPETICQECGHPLKNRALKSHIVIQPGYLQEYKMPCKACDNPACLLYHVLMHVENPDIAPYHHLSYAVQAEIAQNRFEGRKTGNEIVKALPIKTTQGTVGDIIRIYEFGCASQWNPQKIEEIKERGFLFLHVDVIEPMKGKHGILSVHESFAKIALKAMILTDESNEGYAEFFSELKTNLQLLFNVPVVGVMSDALPAQRIAIENEFPDALHCICHYHFLDYVMTDAMKADEHIITQGRARLRKLKDLREYKKLKLKKKDLPLVFQVWHLYFEELLPFMDWKPRPIDPCFSSIQFIDALRGVDDRLTNDYENLLNEEIRVDANTRRSLGRLQAAVHEIVQDHKTTARELQVIHGHVKELTDILEDLNNTAGEGWMRMGLLCREYDIRQADATCGNLEKEFLAQVHIYFETKGKLLFNYRLIPGAPSTNNYEEAQYHSLKHYIRRTIGQQSAKEYLARHGARLFFVNKEAKLEEIETILKHMDQTEARKILDKERPSRSDIENLMHQEHCWVVLNPQHDKLIELLKEETQKYGMVKRSPREILEEKAKNGEDITPYFLL